METKIDTLIRKFSRKGNALNNLQHSEIKPVIKISLDGFLISANTTGIDFLELLADDLKVPAVNYLVKYNPSILDPNCSLDITYRIHDTKYFFSAVAFKEAGYVGLYGFRQVHVSSNGITS